MSWQGGESNGQTALAGIKVLDLTQFEAGPSATETLAWLGAASSRSRTRQAVSSVGTPRPTGTRCRSYYFLLLNANKRSVTWNLRTEKARRCCAR